MKCERCGHEHDGTFGSGRFCSRSCANSIGSKFVDKDKLRNTMRTKSSWYKDGKSKIKIPCKSCGALINKRNKYKCCRKCKDASVEYRKYLSVALKGKCGGIRPGTSRGHHGKYNGDRYDSSWELAWMIYNTEHGIAYNRNCASFKYVHNGETKRFYPDFIQNGTYIEIKNYSSDVLTAKIKQFPHALIVLWKRDIQHCLDYCTKKYGKQFWKVFS